MTRKQRTEKQRTTEDSYLFIMKNIPDEYLETCNEELRKITETALLKLYRGISEKARKSTKSGSYNYVRSHTMRKYFNSALLNAGCDSFHTEFWMGHKLDDTQAAYFRANPEAQKEIYQKYVPYLTIQKEIDVAESPEYITLKNNFEIVVADNVNKTVEREELIRLNDKLETQQEEHENELEEIRKEIYYMKVENQLKLAKEKIKTASPEMIEKYNKIIKDSEELLKKKK
ncbi:MAG: hypothetical protein PHW84_03995 [Methanosarcina sp.]|nr:hypothetical protein [Methanosarcina sp.]